MGGENDACRTADLAQLLHGDGVAQHIRAGAAVLLREINAHHTELAHFLHGLRREHLLLIDLACQRLDLVFRELAEQLLEHCLLPRQLKIHGFRSFILSYLLYS